VRVQALAVAAGELAVAALGHLPVAIAIGHVAVLAETCIVIEPGRVDLGEAQGRPEHLGDLTGPAGVDGVAAAVVGCDALEQQIPLASARRRTMLSRTVPGHCSCPAGTCPGLPDRRGLTGCRIPRRAA
jgi:hypothetical protein